MTENKIKLSALKIIAFPAFFVGIPFFMEFFIYGPHHYNSMWTSIVTILFGCTGCFLLIVYIWKFRTQEKEKILLGILFIWLIAWRVISVIYEIIKNVFISHSEWYDIEEHYFSLWYHNRDMLAYMKYNLLNSDMVGALLFIIIVGQYIIRNPKSILMFIDAALNWYGHLIFNNKDKDFWYKWDFKSTGYTNDNQKYSGFLGKGVMIKLFYILVVLIVYTLIFHPGK